MSTRKRKDGDGGDDERRLPHEEEGNAVRVHEAYLEHRLQGGEPASPDAYRRANEQFQKLPGAVQSTPALVPNPKPDDAPGDKGDDTSQKGGRQ